MPIYRVWYRDNPEPLQFATPNRCSDMEILEHILAQEKIAPAGTEPTVSEIIEKNRLAPVRYTEDESELNVIE